MIIEFRCERDHARQWMCRETLSIDGRDVPVQIAWTEAAEPRPAGLDALFELERVVLHKGKPGGAARLKIVPEPTQTRAAGSRLGDDFLEGAGSSERSTNRTTAAATFGAAEAASLNSAISRQIKPHWNAPQGVDVEQLVTLVRFRLNQDGTLEGRPSCVGQSGETPSNAAQKGLHCERAIRAIQLAAPFDLPDEFYDKWKLVTSRFDRRL